MFKFFSLFKRQKPTFSQANDELHFSENPSPHTSEQYYATQDIIAATPLTTDLNIEEIANNAKERSDRLYEERHQRITSFNPFNIIADPSSTVCLTSTEKYFLKQMHGQNVKNPTVYAYWTYEYSLDFATTMSKLLKNDYLKISTPCNNPSLLTVAELKSVLRAHQLSLTGKKQDLIDRVQKNIPTDELSSDLSHIQKQTYLLTPKGEEATASLPTSMTKNLELEDSCLNLIYSKRFNEAYKLVCENEIKKIIPRGIGCNWEHELSVGLSPFKSKLFSDFWLEKSAAIPLPLTPYTNQLKACVIINIFFGSDARKATDLFFRISPSCDYSKSNITALLQGMTLKLLNAIQKDTFFNLRS